MSNQEEHANLLTYYGSAITFMMDLTEDLILNQLVPIYGSMKAQPEIKLAFFTLLILLIVAKVLSSFNQIFKPKKSSIQFVHGQDVPKDSKALQKQFRILRETVSSLKQQALNSPVVNQKPISQTTVSNNSAQNAELDPEIESRLAKSQQSIEQLRQGLSKIEQIQSDLQASILESQQEVVQRLLAMRSKNQMIKKSLNHSQNNNDQSNSKLQKQHNRSNSSQIEEPSSSVTEKRDQSPERNSNLRAQQEILSVPLVIPQKQESGITSQLQEEQKSIKENQFLNKEAEILSTPPVEQISVSNNPLNIPKVNAIAPRPAPFGARQPPVNMRGKPPIRQAPVPSGPVNLPPH